MRSNRIWCLLVVSLGSICHAAEQPAEAEGQGVNSSLAEEASAVYEHALRLESELQLTEAASLYEGLVKRCDPEADWETLKNARQGLRRIEKFRAVFSLSQDELHQQLVRTFDGYQRGELVEWERRGWIEFRTMDGKRRYGRLNSRNLCFRNRELRQRNDRLAEADREFAQFFLDRAAELEEARPGAQVPRRYVNPAKFVFSMRAEINQADLPPGKTVRAWFPFPLLCPATQDIRILSVEPAGVLKHLPDVEADVGIAYLEVPRPDQDRLTVGLRVSFQAYQTNFAIDPQGVPRYDDQDALYRQFTQSEQHIRLSEPLRKLAHSIVEAESNPYRKARRLYDWVCDNVTYNLIWTWRESLFSPYGCASEDVRKRRVGDCLTQSEFYAALCRSVGVPARVCGGRVFQPGIRNDHFWAEVYFPGCGWMPVDVTFCQGACLAPDLTKAEKQMLRDYFFGHLDRYRLRTHRAQVTQPLVPAKRSPRRRAAFFTLPEFECGGRDVEKCKVTWDCQRFREP